MTNTWTITAMAGDHRSALEREAAIHRLAVRLRRSREMECEMRLLDAYLMVDQPAQPVRKLRPRLHTGAGVAGSSQ